MIQYLSSQGGGASLNYSIVGSTQQPAGRENRIWVNTDQQITGHIFSAEEPANPTEGLVWFKVGTDSVVPFSATKKNPIMVYPQTCQQLISDVWVTKVAKSYIGGDWVDWTLILFSPNNYHEEITGGYESVAVAHASGVTAQKPNLSLAPSTGYMKISRSSGTGSGNASGAVLTKNKINLQSANRIHFEAYSASIGSAGHIWCYITEDQNSVPATKVIINSTNKSVDLDVSSLTSSYYIGIHIYTAAGGDGSSQTTTVEISDIIIE